jgi:hypothetical protein
MKTIHKYPLLSCATQSVQVPQGAELLSVQVQDNNIFFWALVQTARKSTSLRVEIVGTGLPANYSKEAYFGTVQLPPFVWHVFAWPEAA